jgi:hypothetical protein
MKLLPFDKHDTDPAKFEDYNYTTQRDRHITYVITYLSNRVEELITEVNSKEDSINILGNQVDHLTAQMDYMAKLIGDAADAKDFNSLDAIDKWLKTREKDASTRTNRIYTATTRRLP